MTTVRKPSQQEAGKSPASSSSKNIAGGWRHPPAPPSDLSRLSGATLRRYGNSDRPSGEDGSFVVYRAAHLNNPLSWLNSPIELSFERSHSVRQEFLAWALDTGVAVRNAFGLSDGGKIHYAGLVTMTNPANCNAVVDAIIAAIGCPNGIVVEFDTTV